jgi:quercetin dioxygenase-like cupin family protein
VEHGKFEVVIGTEKHVLAEGDSFFIPPDTEHGVAALTEGSIIDVFTPMRLDFLTK